MNLLHQHSQGLIQMNKGIDSVGLGFDACFMQHEILNAFNRYRLMAKNQGVYYRDDINVQSQKSSINLL